MPPVSSRGPLALRFGLLLALAAAIAFLAPRSESMRAFGKRYWALSGAYYSKFLAQTPRSAQDAIEAESRGQGSTHHDPAPPVSPPSGLYDGPLRAVLPRDGSRHWHHTTDGSIPGPLDATLEQGLDVTRTLVLRVNGRTRIGHWSETATRSYVLAPGTDLPVLSLVSDPARLYDLRTGILTHPENRGRAWERPAVLARLGPGGAGTREAEVRIRVHGNSGRGAPRCSFWVRAVGDPLGFGPLVERGGSPRWPQDEWVLRHVPTIYQVHRDRLATRIGRALGIPTLRTVPVVLYLNGREWGVYDLKDRMGAGFVRGAFRGREVTLLRGALAHPEAASGNDREWREFYASLERADLRGDDAFEEVAGRFDLDNLIDYYAFIIFSGDNDRPNSNMDLGRVEDRGRRKRWRFILYDTDQGFSYKGADPGHDTLAWHLRDRPRPDLKQYGSPDTERAVRSTLLFRRLMDHPRFRRRFVERFRQLLDGPLAPGSLDRTFSAMLEEYAGSEAIMLRAFEPGGATIQDYRREVERIRTFLRERPAAVRRLLDGIAP